MAVLELWELSVNKIKELLEAEPDKKEVVLNYSSLWSEYTVLKGSLADFEKIKEEVKEIIFSLKDKMTGSHPLFGAIWDQILTNNSNLLL